MNVKTATYTSRTSIMWQFKQGLTVEQTI